MNQEGINKRQLAIKTGIPQTTIYGLFSKGYANLTLPTLRAIAKYFNVSMDYMSGDTEVRNGKDFKTADCVTSLPAAIDEPHKTYIKKYLELNPEHQANIRGLIDGYTAEEEMAVASSKKGILAG